MELKVAAMTQICFGQVEMVERPKSFREDVNKIADLVDRLLTNPEVNILLLWPYRLLSAPAQPAVTSLGGRRFVQELVFIWQRVGAGGARRRRLGLLAALLSLNNRLHSIRQLWLLYDLAIGANL